MAGRRVARGVVRRPLGSFDADAPAPPTETPPPTAERDEPPEPPSTPAPPARPRLEESSEASLEKRQHAWIRERLRAERAASTSTDADARGSD